MTFEVQQSRPRLFDAVLLAQVRSRFAHVEEDPATGRRTYLESAGGALRLRSVVAEVERLTAIPDNSGRSNPSSSEIDEVIGQGTRDVALLLGAQSGVVAFGESTTVNAFRILRAIISSQPGGNVVTTNLDHPAVYDSTRLLAAWYGKQWRVAGLNPRTGSVEPAEVLKHVDSRTVALALIHDSNVNGAVIDVKTIIREARAVKPDLYVVVDGAQHAPHSLVNVHDLDCDAYLISSYKFFSKMGASCAYLSDRTACLPHEQILGKPNNVWDLGTREAAAYAAWTLVVDYLCWLGAHFRAEGGRKEMAQAGIQAISAHERELHNLLLGGREGLPGLSQLPRLRVYPEAPESERGPIAALGVTGKTASQVVNWLEREGFRVHERVSDAYSKHTLAAMGIQECVRVSLAHYNSPQEVMTFLQTIGRLD